MDFTGYVWVIHCIQVYSINPLGYQVDYLVNCIGYTGISHGFWIMFISLHNSQEFFREIHPTKGNHPLNLLFIHNRHDTCLDRNINSRNGCPFPEGIEIFIIKKKLCYQLICPGINLNLEIPDILNNRPTFPVAFRITGCYNIKITIFLYKGNQVTGISEILLWRQNQG